LKTKLNTTSSN